MPYRGAIRTRELFVKLYPEHPTHPSRIDATVIYGRSLAAACDVAASLPLVSEGAEGAARRFGAQSTIWLILVAHGLSSQAEQRLAEAAAMAGQADDARGQHSARVAQGLTLTQSGLTLLGRGAPDAAAPVLDAAASIGGELLAAPTPSAADLWFTRGRSRLARSDTNPALPELTRVHGCWQQSDARECTRLALGRAARRERQPQTGSQPEFATTQIAHACMRAPD